ncbi:hypothetical protein PFISCL1PPCAC_21424, partial [Pristionchus fissidentatus]
DSTTILPTSRTSALSQDRYLFLQEAGRDVSSAKTYCHAFEPFGKQIKGFLFAARDEEHMKAVENRCIMNQSGSYIVADNGKGATLAVPASGKK